MREGSISVEGANVYFFFFEPWKWGLISICAAKISWLYILKFGFLQSQLDN